MKTAGISALALILLFSCSLKEGIPGAPDLDFSPPRLMKIESSESTEVELWFDEPLGLTNETVLLDNGISAGLEVREENRLVLIPQETPEPGEARTTSLSVQDRHGNSNNFLIRFWGWNPRLPDVVINELNPQGSGNNPDTLELFFLTDGNTAGITLFYGTLNFNSFRYILPSIVVRKGDYLLIHCRPEGLEEEINETEEKDLSQGNLACDTAWDLWLPEDAGLSGSNGVVSLYNSPAGKLMDCVIYSDREPDPEDDKLGWTTATYDAVADIYQSGGWVFSSEDISPLETVSSDGTTGTRSICRNSQSKDSNSKSDWHIVPTGEKSFGEINTDAVYTP